MGRGKNMGKPLATWKDFLQKSRTGGSASYVSVEGDVLYTVFDFQGLSPQSSMFFFPFVFFFFSYLFKTSCWCYLED